MFRGSFEHSIDLKGRLSIPASFRDELTGEHKNRLMVTNFAIEGKKCLDVYPVDEWSRMLEEVRKKPKFDQRMLMFQNYYLGAARECELDAHGRILIPPGLRKYANLRREVVLVSALEKFRVWDQEMWNQVFADAEEKLLHDPDFLSELGI